jgi:site-specific recombinase XerD
MKVTFQKVFNRKKKLNKEGKAVIEIEAYQDRRRKFFSTKIFVRPDQWDNKRREISRKHPQMDELNSQIEEMIKKQEKLQSDNFYQDKPFTIANVLKKTIETHTSGSFIAFMRTGIEKKSDIKEITKVSHRNTLGKLEEFRVKGIEFADINSSFVTDFMDNLREKKLAHNTVHKHHKNLKIYIEAAIKQGFIKQNNPCKDVKIQYKQTPIPALTIEEIQRIEKLDLAKYGDDFALVRDMFLFSCYTGLRISDVTHLKPDYVKKSKDGYSLNFVTHKGSKLADLPLHSLFRAKGKKESKPETILKRYFDENKKYIFHQQDEGFINRMLKIIAAQAKIKINLYFHIGRHSFGTYLATRIPLPHLMELMQHSDINTTMIYVSVTMEQVKKDLKRVKWY